MKKTFLKPSLANVLFLLGLALVALADCSNNNATLQMLWDLLNVSHSDDITVY